MGCTLLIVSFFKLRKGLFQVSPVIIKNNASSKNSCEIQVDCWLVVNSTNGFKSKNEHISEEEGYHLKTLALGISFVWFTSRLMQGESIKRPAFEKIQLPEYQSNDIENCLILSPLCQIMFSNLPGFNRPFLLVEMEIFCRKPLSKTCKDK